jgi:hypothetical protein
VADYCLLHQNWMAEGRFHAGIVVCPQQRYVVGEEPRRLARLISELHGADAKPN